MNFVIIDHQEAITSCEARVNNHAQYQDSYQAASDWLRLMQDRLAMCSDLSGDKHSIANKLDRVQVRLKIGGFLVSHGYHMLLC